MIPYKTKIKISNAVAGEENWVFLPSPIRGYFESFYLRQLSGPKDGFSASLYDTPPVSEEDLSALSEEEFSEDSCLLFTAPDVAAGQSSVRMQFNPRKPFMGWKDEETNATDRLLYLRLTPGGTGAKTFEVSFEISIPEMA